MHCQGAIESQQETASRPQGAYQVRGEIVFGQDSLVLTIYRGLSASRSPGEGNRQASGGAPDSDTNVSLCARISWSTRG